MNLAPHNLKPFSPTKSGTAPAPGTLLPAVRSPSTRYAAAASKDPHEQLVNKTQTWVAQTFFGTLLKQMRNSPFKSELFSGGQGGEKFASLQDQHMAEHMTRGAGRKLVESIVRRIEANAAYAMQQKPRTSPSSSSQSVQPAANADNRTDPRRRDLEPWNKRPTLTPHGQAARRS